MKNKNGRGRREEKMATLEKKKKKRKKKKNGSVKKRKKKKSGEGNDLKASLKTRKGTKFMKYPNYP